MPTMENYKDQSPIKGILIGDSGSGKTGALASLANAGFHLHILDFDNGLDILANTVKPEYLKNIEFEHFIDKKKALPNGTMVFDGMPKAFPSALKTLTAWSTKYKTLQDVIVIDSLTFLGDAVLDYVTASAGRMGQQPQLQDWGTAMARIEDILSLLYSEDVSANVLILAHIKYLEDEATGAIKAQVNALGRALPPKIGRYFNTMIAAQLVGSTRKLKTQATTWLGLKSPNPGKVKSEYPIETGLAEYFADLKR